MGERAGMPSPKAVVALVAMLGAVALVAAIASADVVSGGNARISFHGSISPSTLPRGRAAPVSLHLAGTVHPIGERRPATLRRVTVEINRHGVISTKGLPSCPRKRLLGARSVEALERCGPALVGIGHFTAHVEIPEGAPFPASGRLLVFNASRSGHPALVAHVFGTEPVPTTQVMPISLRRRGTNGFGATMSVAMPQVGHEWGYVTGFDMTFHRLYRYRGRSRSFLAASCPAPSGIAEAPFRAARGTYYLSGGRVLTRVVTGSCRVSSRRG